MYLSHFKASLKSHMPDMFTLKWSILLVISNIEEKKKLCALLKLKISYTLTTWKQKKSIVPFLQNWSNSVPFVLNDEQKFI